MTSFKRICHPFGAAIFMAMLSTPSIAITQGIQRSPTPTVEQIIKKADSGDWDSEFQLAGMYLRGNGIPKDIAKAEYWLIRVSAAGEKTGNYAGEASTYLGDIFLNKYKSGKDPSNLNKALGWYSKAAEQGSYSTFLIAKWYQDGTNGFSKDPSKAVDWFEKCLVGSNPSANMARISLAKIYINGEGVPQDVSKARSLLNEVLSSQDTTGRGEASELMIQINGFRTINALNGNLTRDHIKLPSFYAWRRVYKKRGESHFKQYLVNARGKLVSTALVGPRYDESWRIQSTPPASGSKENKNAATTLTSPSGDWQVMEEPDRVSFNSAQLICKNKSESEPQTLAIPIYEWRGLIGWNPQKDLFYYWTSGGADTGRESMYYQFDPAKRIFTLIGSGGGNLNFSKNGNWIIWINGNRMDYSDRQLMAYNVETNKNYALTKGHSDNGFDVWADSPALAKWEEMSAKAGTYIKKGEKYYRAHEFDAAIGQYKKAIVIDPNNSEAFGFMGYSYFREGKLDEARKALNASLFFNHHNLMSYYNLALVVWAQNQPDQAVTYLKKYISGNKIHQRRVENDPQFKGIIKSDVYKKLILHQ